MVVPLQVTHPGIVSVQQVGLPGHVELPEQVLNPGHEYESGHVGEPLQVVPPHVFAPGQVLAPWHVAKPAQVLPFTQEMVPKHVTLPWQVF